MVSYKKLWHTLLDKNIKKYDLPRIAGISSSTVAKLNRDESVTTEILAKICNALNCDMSDIMEVLPDKTKC